MKNKSRLREDSLFIGDDSTSPIEVEIFQLETKEKDHPPKMDSRAEKASTSDPIQEAIEKVRAEVAEFNVFVNYAGKEQAERAIKIGMGLWEIKNLVKRPGVLWSDWADKNLPFIGERNRQKYMMIAKRQDCHRFTYLGLDRLEALCSATKNIQGQDPIGSLLSQYNITIDETSEMSLSEFRLLVDAALNNEKAKKNDIHTDFELIKNLTREGVTFEKSFLEKLIDIKDSGGNPDVYLRTLSIKGKEEDSESTTEERLKDFNTLSNRLIRTVEYILNQPDHISKVDRKSFLRLLQKLLELQKTGNITEEDAEIA
jgi:hypothetical protein